MPVSIRFTQAVARRLLLGTAMPWGTDWTVRLCAAPAGVISADTQLADLGAVLTGISNLTWSIQDYVAPNPQATPPVAEVTPCASCGPLSWTNANSDRLPVIFRTVVVTAFNSARGANEPIIWEPLSPEVTLEYGKTFSLDTFRFRIKEVSDG